MNSDSVSSAVGSAAKWKDHLQRHQGLLARLVLPTERAFCAAEVRTLQLMDWVKWLVHICVTWRGVFKGSGRPMYTSSVQSGPLRQALSSSVYGTRFESGLTFMLGMLASL